MLHLFRSFRIKYSQCRFLSRFVFDKFFIRKIAFHVYTPEHGNIGDHAIAKATQNLLEKDDIKYREISFNELEKLRSLKKLSILNGKKIIINGGGNLGTLWFCCEQLTRDIILSNPNSKIIILPNTIFYEKSDWGNEELTKSIAIYNKHKDLTIYARERASYEFMKNIYKNVKLCPDMVLSLDETKEIDRIIDCVLFLRNDIEKTMIDSEFNLLDRYVQGHFNQYYYSDTVVKHNISICDRENEIEKKLDEFRSAKLVITDRLHAMIFSAITGTPCIVLNSKSPKVKGCYEWIKHLDYIKFCEDVSDLDNIIKSIPKEFKIYDNTMYSNYYDNLINEIKK